MTAQEPDVDTRTTARGARQHPLLLGLAATSVLAAAVVGVAGLLPGSPAPEPVPTVAATTRPSGATPHPAGAARCPPGRIDAIANLLFTWDTTKSSRQDVIGRIAHVADPSGVETPGLLADLDGYLPSDDAWEVLTGYRTRQTLTGMHTRVPTTWPGIATAAHAVLPVGADAFTITGTRRRSGVVAGARSTAADRVTFTMIVTCPPGTNEWRLLRLSRLGEPLS